MQQSPFENIFNIISGLSQGNEKPLKHGFYNAFALLVLTICCAALYVLFLILEPFFKPLFWALLVGSMLHPFKYSLSKKLKEWFVKLDKTNTSVFMGFAKLPLNIIDEASKLFGSFLEDYYKPIIGFVCALFVIPWLYNWIPRCVICLFWQVSAFLCASIKTMIYVFNSYIMLTVMLGYIVCIYYFWSPAYELIFRRSSLLIWIFFSCYLSSLFNSLQAYVFILLQLMAFAGFIYELIYVHRRLMLNDPLTSIITSLMYVIDNIVPDEIQHNNTTIDDLEFSTPAKDTIDTPDIPIGDSPQINFRKLQKMNTMTSLPLSDSRTKISLEKQLLASLRRKSLADGFIMKNDKENIEAESDTYFTCLFFLCGTVLVWKYCWLLPLMLFLLALYFIRKFGDYVGVWDFIVGRVKAVWDIVSDWCSERIYAVVPAHARGMNKLLTICNKMIRKSAYESVDTVSSAIVIMGLILFLLCYSIFICIQIYSEALVVVQLSGSVLNSTVVRNSELRALLPDGWEGTLDSLIDNAYTYGREGISNAVRNLLKEGDPDKVLRVENQLLELFDRVYQSWISSGGSIGPQVDGNAIHETWDHFVQDITNTPGIFNYTRVLEWLKANVGMLTTIASSIWSPLASNVSLLAGSLAAIGSVLLGGGSALLNFILSSIIFFTTLFYLLTSSNVLYKPIEMITQTLPSIGPKFGYAITVAINQVFRASIKMAIFYGVWTWIIHNVFGAKIIYLPSALAAVLGAAPFLGTWLACIPAVLDIWLAQGRPIAAFLLAIAQAAPTSFVDAAIYAEIKNGGHPYLTGLAIAGGIFYLGPEGAILGPLLLCCLLVVLNLSSAVLRDTPAEERTTLQNRIRYGSML